jgi:CubicO group peptidase (beta-lactamase class C family)
MILIRSFLQILISVFPIWFPMNGIRRCEIFVPWRLRGSCIDCHKDSKAQRKHKDFDGHAGCNNKLPGMLKLVNAVAFMIFVCSCSSRSSEYQEVSKADSTYNFSAIEKKVQLWSDSGYYDGASLLIAKDNQLIFERYFGTYKPETQVYIASAGKWLAAATIATVVDEGKLTWDAKVVQWLPEFTDAKGQATLRQLLSHTSGYPDYQPKGSHRDDYQSLEEAVKHIVNLPADTIPGKKFRYGGLAMQVAGRMAELATSKDWETLFQEKIAKPLNMSNTHFTPVDTTGGHNPMISGGARCTLHDYAHFLEMISNDGMYKGNRILSVAAVYEMQADQVKVARVLPHEYVGNARGLSHASIYGLGEWREILNDAGDAVLLSSPGWAGAYPWIDKDNNIYGFFLAHVNVEKANKDGFSSFYASPVLPLMVREILSKKDAGGVREDFGKIDRSGLCYAKDIGYEY